MVLITACNVLSLTTSISFYPGVDWLKAFLDLCHWPRTHHRTGAAVCRPSMPIWFMEQLQSVCMRRSFPITHSHLPAESLLQSFRIFPLWGGSDTRRELTEGDCLHCGCVGTGTSEHWGQWAGVVMESSRQWGFPRALICFHSSSSPWVPLKPPNYSQYLIQSAKK